MTPILHLTGIHLRVSDLERSGAFYSERLGFVVRARTPHMISLATSPDRDPLLSLSTAPHAGPAAGETAGLFHAALLLPDRAALGGWLAFASRRQVEFAGFSDHGVSEAVYLSDPDGNGLEFYADRPRTAWPIAGGELAMVTRPLDLRSLPAGANRPASEPLRGAAWGHLHLKVTNLERSEAFYTERLGLHVTQRSYPGARFLAADDYHHHLGLNTWGHPRRPAPTETPGLARAVFRHAGTAARTALVDPDGIALEVEPLTS